MNKEFYISLSRLDTNKIAIKYEIDIHSSKPSFNRQFLNKYPTK